MVGVALPVLGALGGSLLFGSVTVDQALFARAEIAAGQAAPTPSGDPEPALTAELRPGAGLRIRSLRSTSILRLEPRFYYRTPNLAGLDRPLFLWRGTGSHAYDLSPRLQWITHAGATYGEVDYASSQLAFGQVLTQELDDPVLTSLGLDGRTGFAWQAARRYRIELAAVGAFSKTESATTEVGFPETVTLGADFVQRWELDPRSLLGVPISVRRYFVTPGPDQFATFVDVEYTRRLQERSTLGARAGTTVAFPEGRSGDVYPRGALWFEHILNNVPGRRALYRLEAVIGTSFDPIVAEVQPVASVQVRVGADLAPTWSLAFDLNASTVTAAEPRTEGGSESSLFASAMAIHRVAPWFLFDFGTRFTTRASHFAAETWELMDPQVWVFSGITVVLAQSSGDDGFWAP